MLKNWTVKTKQIKKQSKGFANHINYLTDKNRASHANTRFVVFNHAARAIVEEIENRKHHRQKEGLRGGGVSNYCTSIILVLPRDIPQPTDEQWKEIGNRVLDKIAKRNSLALDELKRLTNIVLHDESEGKKYTHLNLSISNVFGNDVVKGISQYRTTHATKWAFNDVVRDILGVDNYEYQPTNENVGDKPLNVAREEKAKALMLQADVKTGIAEGKALNAEEREHEANKRARNAEIRANKALKKEKTATSNYEKLKHSFSSWFNRIINKQDAELVAKKSAVLLDKMDFETPNKVIETEQKRKIKEANKITSKRKRRRRKAPSGT